MYPTLIPLRSARTPHLGRLTTLLVLAVAAAGLAGCSESSGPAGAPEATTPDLRFEPNALTLAPGDTARTTVRVETGADLRGATFTLDGAPPGLTTRFEAAADGASGKLTLAASTNVKTIAWSLTVKGRRADGAKTWVGSLALTVSSPSARTFFVDPATGSDGNSGSQDKPFKTLGKALSKARSGDAVKLAGGGYGPTATSGEQFPATGLAVPTGVTIEGALDGGFPVSTLVGTGGGVGLNFAGDATVRNLAVGGTGFGVGLFAKQGALTLSNVFLGVAAQSAVVDGVTLSGGIVLRGTAQATLLAGASGSNTTGSTIFLTGTGGTGVNVIEQARFTMDGGTITGGGVNCRTGVRGIFLRDQAQATLTNVVVFQITGVALDMENASKATLTQSTISRNLPDGCAPPVNVSLSQSASLSLRARSRMNGGASAGTTLGGVGIQMLSDGPLTIAEGSGIGGYATGIKVSGKGNLAVDKADFRNHVGIDATFAQGSVTITNSSFTTGSTFEPSPGTGTIGIIASKLKLRNSEVSSTATGIVITGPGVDLGTINDPGNNRFTDNGTTSVTFSANGAGNSIVSAMGNTWSPNTQGADASGHYTQHILVTQASPLAFGKNFKLMSLGGGLANFQIQL